MNKSSSGGPRERGEESSKKDSAITKEWTEKMCRCGHRFGKHYADFQPGRSNCSACEDCTVMIEA